jgi:hypothetical protein
MHIEKKSLVGKMAATASKPNFIHSRFRVDLSKPAPVRVQTCMMRASGDKRVKYM